MNNDIQHRRLLTCPLPWQRELGRYLLDHSECLEIEIKFSENPIVLILFYRGKRFFLAKFFEDRYTLGYRGQMLDLGTFEYIFQYIFSINNQLR